MSLMFVRWVSGARRGAVVLALAGSLLGGCATAEEGEVWDPLETPNRFLFAINKTLDTFILRPVAVAYRDLTPNGVQRGTRNVLNNLGEPVTAVNELAQGEGTRAVQTIARFLINSTLGLLGIFDVAKDFGLPHTKEDFGQTIGVWAKAPPEDGGPYLVLPLAGPSNARDAVGILVDYLIDPFRIGAEQLDVEWLLYARSGLDAVDARSRTLQALDDLEKNSVDYYSAVRSAYTQRRAAQIRQRGVVSTSSLPLDGPGRAELGLAR
jgi:phospholipid-binding lipoprotein MlaA